MQINFKKLYYAYIIKHCIHFKYKLSIKFIQMMQYFKTLLVLNIDLLIGEFYIINIEYMHLMKQKCKRLHR